MLEGDLGDFTLPDILNLLAFTSKSGRLGIVTEHARGRVDLVDGRVRDASADADHLPLARRLLGRGLLDGATLQTLLDDVTSLPTDLELARRLVTAEHASSSDVAEVLREQTLDAVFDLMRWPTGTFRFEAGAQATADAPDLALTVEEALAEAERRLEAWTQIHERTGPGDGVVTVGRPADAAVEVDADGWQLIGLADGHRTIDDLAVLCGRGQFDTRSTLAGLLESGVVSVAADGSTGLVERLLSDQALLSRLEADLGTNVVPPVGERPAPPAPVAPVTPAADEGAATAASEVWEATVSASADAEVHEITAKRAEEPSEPLEPSVGLGAEPLRPAGRAGRLRPDPSIDVELVSRLIDGVEGL